MTKKSWSQELKLLIVDDDPMILKATERQLRQEFCEIAMANSVRKALEILELEHHDIVLSDWDMPDGGGKEIIAKSYAPVVIHSGGIGWMAKSDEREVSKASAYVEKPSTTHDLLNALRKAYDSTK